MTGDGRSTSDIGHPTSDMKPFKLIIGLGNNDPQYANTYHNVGHLFVDYLEKHYPALAAKKTAGYMNESGASVGAMMKKTFASPEHTLIVHDESDIYIGEYKISTARGAAGHKGVQSVFDATGSTDFTRLRVGIRPKTEGARHPKAETFVLKKISATGKKQFMDVFQKAANELFGAPEIPQ
ncbi:MAG: hypothetical protein Q7R85_04035 [bacterium]|nr:hypothetical protein [bacterium]